MGACHLVLHEIQIDTNIAEKVAKLFKILLDKLQIDRKVVHSVLSSRLSRFALDVSRIALSWAK